MVIKEIKNRVLERLCKLTTINYKQRKVKIEEIYLEYVKALRDSELLKGEFPTFRVIEY